MALLGTLKGFGVTEIFQLISQQMKTGTLILTSPESTVSIIFNNGVIEGIKSDRWELDPRAENLIRAGFLSEKDYRAAVENEKKNSHRWHDILSKQGKLNETFLQRASNVVIKTVLLEVFQWKEGNYRFEDWDLDTENVLSCNIPSEGVILDTLRIIDEWPMIKQKIPPVDYCPVTILPLTEEIVREHRLTAVDMHVYDLIDEQKNVECIVRQSLEPPFEALSSLVKLIESGLIEVFPQGTKELRDSSIARRIFLMKVKRISVFVLLAAAVGLLLLVGKPRVFTGAGIPGEITRCIHHQEELPRDYEQRGIWLSTLNTGGDSRLSASSRE
ncbi:MAG: DUF4388 domain-containing protein [Desulfomonilia bacterium]|jgi:hypothetical protein